MKIYTVNRFLVFIMIICLAACASGNKIEKKNQAFAFRELGEAYMGQGEYTKALREFKKAEELFSKDHLLQEDLGLAYLAKGSPDQAIEHLKLSLKIKPDYSPALNNLGTAYMEKEDWQAAIDCFLKVKEDMLYMTPHYPLTNLGFAYYKLKEYDKAVSYLKEAIELNSKFPKAYHNLGLVYIATGDYDKAIASLERAAELAPKEAPIYFDLGTAYKLNRDYGKAYQSFKKAAEFAQKPEIKRQAEQEAQSIWNLK